MRSPGGYLGEDVDVLFDFIHSGEESKREYARRTYRDGEMLAKDRITGDYNDFWAGRDYLNDMEPMKAALLMSHGFNDWNVMPEHSYRIYDKARDMGLDVQIYYHQDGHGGPPPVSQMNRWFTRYLHGVENGVENDPKAWIVREDAEHENPTPYEDYPHPDAAPVQLYPEGGAPARGALVRKASGKQGTETLVDNYSFSAGTLAGAEYSDHRLLYVSPVLKEDLHISGKPVFSVRAASSKPAVNLSVYLVSLPWNEGRKVKITDNIITRGWADLQNHKSLWKSEPLVPGKFYEMSFEMQPDDQVIPAGQQVGLMIFSSDRDFTLRPQPGTGLTVDLDGTSITLPVVGGEQAWQKAVGE